MSQIGIWVLLLTPISLSLFHAVFLRLFSGSPQKQTIRSLTLFLPTQCAVFWMVESTHSLNSALYFGICSLCFVHIYFHFFNMSETARRIRILVSLYKTGELPSVVDYKPEDLVRIRLQRLKELNQVSIKGDELKAKSGPLLWASILIKNLEFILFPERKSV